MYIHVNAKTNQKKEQMRLLKEGYFEVFVREKAEKNMANKRLLELLKTHFNKSNIRIINGHHSSNKLISIED